MLVGGVPSSYIHLDDPLRLEFEYLCWAGELLDVLAPQGNPLDIAHLGGAGCSLPRYVAATRPRSRQVVFELDPAVIELARATFGYSRRSGFRLRESDALAGLQAARTHSQDVIIRDAFMGDETPAHLTRSSFLSEVKRVLKPGGVYLANITDRPGLGLVKQEISTAAQQFARLWLIGETQHLRGRRRGNVLLIASNARIADAELTRRLARSPVPTRLVLPEATLALAAGVRPIPG